MSERTLSGSVDYSTLLDSEIRAFIEKTNASYPPDAVDLSIQQQREVYDQMCAAFRVGYPDGVSAEDGLIPSPQPLSLTENAIKAKPPSIPLSHVYKTKRVNQRGRRYQQSPVPSRLSAPPLAKEGPGVDFSLPFTTPSIREGGKGAIPIRTYHLANSTPAAQILYYHGGGFVVGGLESHDDSCAELCARSGLPLTSVDYRLAPEHIHPAAFDDALAAYQHVATHSELPIILMGDSAGATLAAAVSHATRDQPVKPLAQILIYPALGGDKGKGSYIDHAEAPMLTTKDMQFYHDIVSGGMDIDNDIRLNLLADSDFSALPPTTVITAQCDPLSDDGRDYRDCILAAGGQAEWFNEVGLVHGYLRARHCSIRAGASFTRMVDALIAYSQTR